MANLVGHSAQFKFGRMGALRKAVAALPHSKIKPRGFGLGARRNKWRLQNAIIAGVADRRWLVGKAVRPLEDWIPVAKARSGSRWKISWGNR
jgi:hypothetical protein